MTDCPFCAIVAGTAPARVVYHYLDAWVIEPLNPVVEGHLLVISCMHADDFTTDRRLTGRVMRHASVEANVRGGDWNLITSKGAAATQSVGHFHVHLVPRREGDQLKLPWTDQQREATS